MSNIFGSREDTMVKRYGRKGTLERGKGVRTMESILVGMGVDKAKGEE